MHIKSDSEVTSIEASTPPRSPRRPLYYVQSPSQHDVEKMSYGSSPMGSPQHHHHHYHCSPVHHSRESSSTTRFSASVKNPRNLSTWKKIHNELDEDEEDDDFDERGQINRVKFYMIWFVFSFVVLFTVFSLILYGASKAYKPTITMKDMVFDDFTIQAGMDGSGVPTEMLTMKSKVRMMYRNPATFFGVHVSATPFELYYYDLKVASGYYVIVVVSEDLLYFGTGLTISPGFMMKEFYQSRKSENKITTTVSATQVPLYGGLSTRNTQLEKETVPLNLTFVVRSRAYVLGKLVKPKFYRKIRCLVNVKGNRLGHPFNLTNKCAYH
ncbi:hypothetical protein IFM89_021797 [Coptis chinensis]|uniref:Late embryogenesis abundant protein LEA-2 subgroup domain-containing protein n=1 Tax=Coptis chinensis TaxID=261450 RepID=A0A835ITU8_9MAGN|nr:hypothetical protein IFM89_021797 [Coptis chinensis]